MAKIYIVATPIGNLEDMTHRAVRILKEVDVILCEDTRVTSRLLKHYEIETKTLSYHAQSGFAKVEKIFGLIEEGKNLALVSDAGTPTISDPGVVLIQQVKEKFGDAIEIIPIPGVSALITALSASGAVTAPFTFLGFLPHKKGRETIFKALGTTRETVLFYESPHRILKALESLVKVLPKDRRVIVARELTKIHEEFVDGSAQEVFDYYTTNPDKVRGEFVVIIDTY